MRFSISEITELIKARRTIFPKDYTDRVVQRDIIDRVLGNATWAPTHGMTQPWRFKVFTGEARQKLSTFLGEEYMRVTPTDKFLQRKFDNHTQRPMQSSVVISIGMARQPTQKITELDEIMAVAAGVQNMHLTCAAYGLGAFWSTSSIVMGDAMERFLELEEHDRCLGLFFIGYPAVEWSKGYRKPLNEFVEYVDG